MVSSKTILSLSCKCEIPKSIKNYTVHTETQWCAVSYKDANKNTTLLLICIASRASDIFVENI